MTSFQALLRVFCWCVVLFATTTSFLNAQYFDSFKVSESQQWPAEPLKQVSLSRVGETPRAVAPADNSILYCPGASVQLRWTGVSDVTNYFVEIARDPGMTQFILKTMVQFDTSLACPISKTTTDYYWRISTGSVSSEIAHFRIAYATSVQLALRYNGATVTSDQVPFRWTKDEAATSYTIQIVSPSVENRTETTADTSITLTLVRNELVRWRVQPVCSAGAGAWSERDSLIVAPEINDVAASDANAVQSYPNPVSTEFVLLYGQSVKNPMQIIVFNELGETVEVVARQSDECVIVDCSALTNGIYVVRVQDRSTTVVKKFVVSH